MRKLKEKGTSGFALVELIIVMVIISILVIMVLRSFLPSVDLAKVNKARYDLRSVEEALEVYKVDYGAYPRGSTSNEIMDNYPHPLKILEEEGYMKILPKYYSYEYGYDIYREDYLLVIPTGIEDGVVKSE